MSDNKQPNPNGANGTTSDPREQVCWDLYVQSILKGQENARQSAIQAGYGEAHADNITIQGWFKERKAKLKRKDMLSKAERNLDKALDTEYVNAEGVIKSDVMKIVIDVSKTIVTTLGKDEGYVSRLENTGKHGEPLFNKLSEEEQAKLDSIL